MADQKAQTQTKKRSSLWVKLTHDNTALSLSGNKLDESTGIRLQVSNTVIVPVNDDYCCLVGILWDVSDWDTDYASKSLINLPMPFEMKVHLRDWQQKYKESTTNKFRSDASDFILSRIKEMQEGETGITAYLNWTSYDRESVEMAQDLPENKKAILYKAIVSPFTLAPAMIEQEAPLLAILPKIIEAVKNPKGGNGGGKDYTPGYVKALAWLCEDLKRLGIEAKNPEDISPAYLLSSTADVEQLALRQRWLEGVELISKLM